MGSKSGDVQSAQWIIPFPSIPSRGRDINPPSSSRAMSSPLYFQLKMYCPLPSIQLGRRTLIWKSAAQQRAMGASLSLPHSSPGFLPAGRRRVRCDRQIPRDDREPFIRPDFNAALPVGNMFWLSGLSHGSSGAGGQIQMLPSTAQTNARPERGLPAWIPINHINVTPSSAATVRLFLMGTASFLPSAILEDTTGPATAPRWGPWTHSELCSHHQHLQALVEATSCRAYSWQQRQNSCSVSQHTATWSRQPGQPRGKQGCGGQFLCWW